MPAIVTIQANTIESTSAGTRRRAKAAEPAPLAIRILASVLLVIAARRGDQADLRRQARIGFVPEAMRDGGKHRHAAGCDREQENTTQMHGQRAQHRRQRETADAGWPAIRAGTLAAFTRQTDQKTNAKRDDERKPGG